MARVEISDPVWADLDRIVDHLRAHDANDPLGRVDEILEAFGILARHPQIGRPVRDASGRAMRELVIGEGAHGYVALYEHRIAFDLGLVLAIRAQREAGFRET